MLKVHLSTRSWLTTLLLNVQFYYFWSSVGPLVSSMLVDLLVYFTYTTDLLFKRYLMELKEPISLFYEVTFQGFGEQVWPRKCSGFVFFQFGRVYITEKWAMIVIIPSYSWVNFHFNRLAYERILVCTTPSFAKLSLIQLNFYAKALKGTDNDVSNSTINFPHRMR